MRAAPTSEKKHGRKVARRKADPAYEPSRTKLGAALRRIRRRILESGEPMLTASQLGREVAERRGGAR